jgi:signal transduction histidine kinase
MARARPFVSLSSILVVVVVGLLIVGGFLAVRQSVENQNHALLETQGGQVTELLQSALSEEGSALTAIDAVADATGASPSVFQAQAAPLAKTPGTTIALVRSGQVLAAVGPGLIAGQTLPAPLAARVSQGAPQLFATGVLRVGSDQVIAFIVGGGPTDTAVVDESLVHPSATSATATGPYNQINIALYAESTAQPGQLIITTKRPLPLPGPVVDTVLPIGSSNWLVLTAAKTPLAGTWANAFPWILLGVGFVLALSLGAVVEILKRRQLYATQLVDESKMELLSTQHELVRRERLSAVGEMAAMIGHELRNPLGTSINGLFLARSRLGAYDDPELDGHLDLVEREINRAAALAEDLTAFMREREPKLATLDLRGVIDEILESAPPPPGTDVSVPEPGVVVEADRALLVQMLTNLLTNAYQAMPDGGTLRVASSQGDGFAEITVEDSGAGMDPAVADQVMEPFFTTKATGTGLGLAIVKRLAEAHQGTVSIANGETGGARVTLRLPRATTEGVP